MTDRPRPTPPPGRTTAPRPPRTENAAGAKPEPRHQIPADQYIRLHALRLSTDYHRSRALVKDAEIFDLAVAFERFIRTGKTEG